MSKSALKNKKRKEAAKAKAAAGGGGGGGGEQASDLDVLTEGFGYSDNRLQ